MTNELPAEIADAMDLAATAASNLTTAEYTEKAARAELAEAAAAHDRAEEALADADRAEAQARRDYLAVLRRHGYVQTADGPRPAHTVHA
jgi:hypothetical protein